MEESAARGGQVYGLNNQSMYIIKKRNPENTYRITSGFVMLPLTATCFGATRAPSASAFL